MTYNDFSLPENWHTIAKAYAHSLKDKGFVFVRMSPDEKKKNDLASACFYNLNNLEKLYTQTQKRNFQNQNNNFAKLALLSSELAKYLESFYILEKKYSTNTQANFNFPLTIFKNETLVIKKLMLLLDEEDNQQIRQFLNTSLHSRLSALSQLFS